MSFDPISKNNPLILASASPRRKRLLEQIKMPFLSQPSNIDEICVDENPHLNVQILAEKKAKAIVSVSDKRWVLGADTIVVLGDRILGKPSDNNDAEVMLNLLKGKEHEVVTGFCILSPSGETVHLDSSSTFVVMKELTDMEINAYIASGEPFGKAGSYAIQGVGSFLIASISGSYTNVVGLPICALIQALLKIGALGCFPLVE